MPAEQIEETTAVTIPIKPEIHHSVLRRVGRNLWLWRLLIVVVTLSLWQFISSGFGLTFFISTPSSVAERLWMWLQTGYLISQLKYTLAEAGIGYFIGAVVGMAAGVMLGLWKIMGNILDPMITALFAIPIVALGPLFILWFGVGSTMKVVLASILVFFFVFWNSYAGIRNSDEGLVNVMRVMGASRIQLLVKFWIPGGLPFTYVGLKAAVPQAFLGAVIGELVSSSHGLGFLLLSSGNQFDTAGIFVVLVCLFLIVGGLNLAVNRLELYLFRWRDPGR